MIDLRGGGAISYTFMAHVLEDELTVTVGVITWMLVGPETEFNTQIR